MGKSNTGPSQATSQIQPVQSKSIETQTENMQFIDQYEGHFYNIKENDTKTTIQFKSAVLCDIVQSKITADFNQPLDVTRNNISTRVLNVKCKLSLDLETNELVITGPAHRTWTEIKFRRKMPEFFVPVYWSNKCNAR